MRSVILGVKLQKENGTEEENLLPFKAKYCNLVSRLSCDGMEELRLLDSRLKYVSAPRLPMVEGRLPVRLILVKDKLTTLPKVSQVTPLQALVPVPLQGL